MSKKQHIAVTEWLPVFLIDVLVVVLFLDFVPKPFAGEVDEDDKKSQEEHQVVCVDLSKLQ